MKYFDTHIFVIIHFAPLFSVYIRVTQLYVTIFQRVRTETQRQYCQFVKNNC